MKSCKAIYSVFTAVLCVVLAVTGTSAVWAQARTTPVEVKNQIGITGNPGVSQYGTWNVGLTGTPNVNVANTPLSVGITGTANVSVTNNPNVSVTNTPTVNISSTNNTVKAPTQWNKVQLWTSHQVLAIGGYTDTAYFSTAGYKEIRACIASNSSSANLQVLVAALGFGQSVVVAEGNFAPPANFISLGGNLTCTDYKCIFSLPVMSDAMSIYIFNNTGGSVTIYSYSWVYLVN